MRRYVVPASIVGVAALLLGLLFFGLAAQGTDHSIDASLARGVRPPAPDAGLAMPLLGSSRTETLADFRGKVVVVNVFASWCQPCLAEAPILEHAEQQISGRGGTILGITYLDNSSDSEQFVRAQHITYPVLRDVNGNFVRAFGTTGVPETFVIDRHGRVAAVRRYQIVGDWLQRTLQPILAQPA
jgi:cytochrome c biogenesis protein CcmG/thiol:disulfide interchange protein DsbE